MTTRTPVLLSFNGGYVDTAGFLALQGLFTAHVTGNFVTFGAAMVQGASGGTAKLLALPVFCIVVIAVQLISSRLRAFGLPVLNSILLLKIVLLALAAMLAILWGPYSDGDNWRAILTGMVLVAAMAIQNAASRIYFGKFPPSTLMTGTSTQIMIDLADLFTGNLTEQTRSAALARVGRMCTAVAAFASGCGAAAIIFANLDMSVFLAPPLVALLALITLRTDSEAA